MGGGPDGLSFGRDVIGGAVGGLQHERSHAEVYLPGFLFQPPFGDGVDPQLKTARLGCRTRPR